MAGNGEEIIFETREFMNPKLRAHAGQQRRQVHGLGDVIVGTALRRVYDGLTAGVRRNHDDRQVQSRVVAPDLF